MFYVILVLVASPDIYHRSKANDRKDARRAKRNNLADALIIFQ